MKKLLVFLFLMAVSGCPTPYHAIENSGGMGGYYQQRLSDDTFKIVFRGNGYTGYKRAHDFALLRAAEICHELGYTHFAKEGQADSSITSVVDMGSTSYTTGSVYGTDDLAFYQGTTRTYSNSMPLLKPGIEIVVRYFQGKPTGRYLEIFEAESVIQVLSKKYNLDLGNRSKPISFIQRENVSLKLESLEQAAIIDPNNASAWAALAFAHAEQKNFSKAFMYQKKALELADDDIKDEYEKRLAAYKARKPWRE